MESAIVYLVHKLSCSVPEPALDGDMATIINARIKAGREF
jgi:hypothetical protein